MRVERFDKHVGDRGGPPVDSGAALLLKVEEAALRLQVGRTTMYDLIRRGEVDSVPIGRLRRIPAECLDEYVERLRARTGSSRRPTA